MFLSGWGKSYRFHRVGCRARIMEGKVERFPKWGLPATGSALLKVEDNNTP